MKYVKIVVTMDQYSELVIPMIFSNMLVHSKVAEMAGKMIEIQWPGKKYRVEGAGDIAFALGSIQCGGQSTSLNVKAAPTDVRDIQFNDVMGLRTPHASDLFDALTTKMVAYDGNKTCAGCGKPFPARYPFDMCGSCMEEVI